MNYSGNKKIKDILEKKYLQNIHKSLHNIFIDRVIIDLNDKRMKIKLSSKYIIKESYLEKLKQIFCDYFYEFNDIDIIIRYFIDEDLRLYFEEYWENIVLNIERNIPSSKSWTDKLSYSVGDNSLNIIAYNDIMLYTLKKSNIDKIVKDKIKCELGKDIKVVYTISNNKKHEINYLYKKEEEEKKLLEKVISINTRRKDENGNGENIRKVSNYIYGKEIVEDPIEISEIDLNIGKAVIEGEIFDTELKKLRNGNYLFIFNVTDYTNSITVKLFAKKNSIENLSLALKDGAYAKIDGDIIFDSFIKQIVLMGKNINFKGKPVRKDLSERKRVELHLHTQMSAMDGINSFLNLSGRAAEWGHSAIAITDHGVVQGFPEAMEASEKYNIKVIYGIEGYLVNDTKPIVINCGDENIDSRYVVFDIETTGLSPQSDKITEIGAVKIENGQIIDRYSQLINPQKKIPGKIVQLTGINDEMVSNKPTIEEVLPQFLQFIGDDSILVAHNASFDVGFIRYNSNKNGIEINNPVLDTLQLSKSLFPNLKNYKLDTICKYLKVSLENHHRAIDDATATGQVFLKCIDILKDKGFCTLLDINKKLSETKNIFKEEMYHIILLVKNQDGLKNLYKIVSESHLKYFYRKPRIPKTLLMQYRNGLLIGSACEAGELYKAIIKNKDLNEIKNIVNFYDYLEIQPIGNNQHLIRNGIINDEEGLRQINKKIVELGEIYQKPVVATGDVHFLDPQDEIYRRILMNGQGYNDADNQPPLYFKTTDEMLEEFSYLGEKKAEEVVIDNPNKIAEVIENLKPIPDGTYPPEIEGAEEELKTITHNNAIKVYGDPLPDIVQERLDKELNSVIKNGYAVLYIIAQKLVSKSLSDGYLVGSRGSVGSSFVATMSGITEVNPLPPHYVCPNCKNSEFIMDNSVGSGIDLPDKCCSKCGTKYKKDGYDIPFEVFLGFEGDKEPDIDLNFAGEYQPIAHKYIEELFGEGYVFRAGTIGTIAEKTAYGFVKKYFDEKNISIHPAEINRLVKGCTGIKRTSGQHPGGIMIVPKHKEIYDFTPVQYPADDRKSGVITTHFDYHSISGRILKLDILGHDVPTIIRMLEDMTGVDPATIPLDDKETMKLFVSTKPLGVSKDEIGTEVGTLGIPEFGTKFVRQMLVDTKPTTFAELVRISGLSHGTDVWLNNAQDLVRNGTAKLSNVISTRDDIMLYLIDKGLDKKASFKIMEKVRKGKGLTEENEKYMRDMNVPNWYIDSCKKIKYMFPKAHAVAYVMMSFRIAYFKVHFPEAFYATYFTTKASDFDAELVLKGKEAVRDKIKELESLNSEKTAKDKNLLTVLEVVNEMYSRGYNFEKVDLYRSDSDKFLIGENGIVPPLKSLQGVGETAARKIVEERSRGKFLSIEDLVYKTKVSKTVVEALKNHGCLDNMYESNQLSLFNI